jgi:hypothetical protein
MTPAKEKVKFTSKDVPSKSHNRILSRRKVHLEAACGIPECSRVSIDGNDV